MKRRNSGRVLILTFVLAGALLSAALVSAAETAADPAKEVGEKAVSFHYNPQGKINPFKPFIRKETPGPKKGPPKFLYPLQRYGIEQLKLIGIMSSENRTAAIVLDPRGKSYVIVKGTMIGPNNGRVAKILDDQVIVEEKTGDGRKSKTRSIILNLHRAETEGKL